MVSFQEGYQEKGRNWSQLSQELVRRSYAILRSAAIPVLQSESTLSYRIQVKV